MFTLYGAQTQNTFKVLYVLEELEVKYDYVPINLMKGEQKQARLLSINPIGKVPVLQHDNFNLFESGAICRYLANFTNSNLYSREAKSRALTDQWLDFFSCHLGFWLSNLFFEKIIKVYAKIGEPDEKRCAQALELSHQQFKIVDQHLSQSTYFTGNALSIADLCAYAYIEQIEVLDIDISNYSNLKTWYTTIFQRQSVSRAKAIIQEN